MELGQLRRLMSERKVSQADLARLLNLSSDKVSKIFSGTRKIQLAEADAIRAHFGIEGFSGFPPMLGVRRFGKEINEGEEESRMASPDPGIRNAEWWTLEDRRGDLIAEPGDKLLANYDDTELVDGKPYLVRHHGGEETVLIYSAADGRFRDCSTDPAFDADVAADDPTLFVLGRITHRTTVV